MSCPTCGTANLAGAKFCSECGSRLANTCPSCGSVNAPGARFCNECGARLGAADATASRPPEVPATPSQPSTGSTERRMVTVLFADLVGFTTLAADRDPETVRDLLSRYFDVARDVVGRYGGTIEKFIGDAVMAVWGTPIAREDDAERAVRAGLDLVDSVGVLGREAAVGIDLQLRAGILTGEVAVTIGATGQGMVAGDIVNTASRLQSVAPPGSVLVGEATQRAADRAIVFEPAGEQVLKGKTAPVPAWRALRVVAERGGQNRAEGVEAPFVGRDDELRLLKDRFHATARERRVRLVSVTGQAGIGKSRLAWEFLKYIDGLVETIYWHDGRSPAYGDGLTFWALGEMVRQRAGLVEADDEATTRERIAATLAEYVADEAERRWIEPALLALLAVQEAPPGGRESLFVAWRTFFERIAADHPAVLVFEDLQYADAGLLDFIDHLLDWSIGHPIFILTLARPELLDRRSDWGAGRRDFLAVGLEPLSEGAMRQLLAGFVPGLPESAVARILERAGGIPLYAVETVRMLVAEGRLEAAEGVYRPVGDLTTLAVPESLHALIAARLDALDPIDRSLLQDGAVLGQTFAPAALAPLSGQATEEIETRLRALVRREIVALDTDPRSPERGQFGFTQALIREVAYGSLSRKERRSRHLAAARYFESLEGSEVAGALAAHYLDAWHAAPEGPEGEAVAVQARLALRGAAERAASLGSHEQELTFLERALTVASEPADEAELHERAGAAAGSAGLIERALDHLHRAEQIHRERADRAAIVRVSATLARTYTDGASNDEAIAVVRPALEEFVDLAGQAPMVELESQLARALFLLGKLDEALPIADRVLADAERLDLVAVLADNLVTKGTILGNSGRPREGIALLEAGRRLAEAEVLPRTMARGAINLSAVLSTNDPRGALEVIRAGLEVATRFGLFPMRLTLAGNAVATATSIGDWDWALTLLDETLGSGDADQSTMVGAIAGGLEIRFLRGEPMGEQEARVRSITEGLDAANREVVRSDLATVKALAEGRLRDAIEQAYKMTAVADYLGNYAMPFAARAAIWLGDVAALRQAIDKFPEVGMHRGLVDAQRTWMKAAIAALEGDRGQALALYRDARRSLQELGLRFELALVGLDMAHDLGPGEAEVDDAIAEARQILGDLRARPLIERLEAAVADGAAGTSAGTVAVARASSAIGSSGDQAARA